MNIRARISQSIVVIGLFLLSIGLLTGTAQAKKPLTPGCFDNSTNQYVDCGNGTMTDNVTGLIWMSNPDCLVQAQTWADAKLVAASLKHKDCGLRDNSKPGDWRLMTADEWNVTINSLFLTFGGDPSIDILPGVFPGAVNTLNLLNAGTECWLSDNLGAFPSTSAETMTGDGDNDRIKTSLRCFWPVRSGNAP